VSVLDRYERAVREQEEDDRRARARARQTDPATSHQAAASVHSLTLKQKAVLNVLRGIGPLSDESLVALYQRGGIAYSDVPQSDSGIRTRRSELVALGHVRNAGIGRTRTGRRCQLWRAA
jgi:ribulose-5-phosphate 4-epimerase/fuculose-1-phosphate aldolase